MTGLDSTSGGGETYDHYYPEAQDLSQMDRAWFFSVLISGVHGDDIRSLV